MSSDVKCQPHPKQLHLLVLLKGCLPSQFTEKHCVTFESSATCSNEFYSANLPASSPTLAAPSANCYASLQWLLTQSENKRSRQTPSRRTFSKDCVFVQEKMWRFAQNCSFQERWEDVSFVGHPSGTPWALQLSFPATLYNIKFDSMIFNFLLHLLGQNSKHHETSWKHHEISRRGTWHFTRTVPPPAAVSLPAHVQWSHALRASGATPRLLAARNVRATQMAKAC